MKTMIIITTSLIDRTSQIKRVVITPKGKKKKEIRKKAACIIQALTIITHAPTKMAKKRDLRLKGFRYLMMVVRELIDLVRLRKNGEEIKKRRLRQRMSSKSSKFTRFSSSDHTFFIFDIDNSG